MPRTTPIRRTYVLRICVVLAAAVLVDSGAALLAAPSVPPSASTQFRDAAHSAEIERSALLRDGGPGVLAPMTPGGPDNADPFGDDPSAPGALGIPEVVLAAYQRAEVTMGTEAPECGVAWWMLAAIGKMESDHADGGLVDEAGTTLTPIFGVWLDGSNGTAAIAAPGPATSPPVWERAMGPMQFLPATWATYGGGGDPHNVNDAALAAARYLCADGESLSELDRLATAVYRYNHSTSYVAAVLAWAETYAVGPVVPLSSSSAAAASATAPGTSSAGTLAAAAVAVAFATDQLGLPYVWGGNGPANGDAGFDCSGLTHAAYVAAGIPTPRTAQTQYNAGPRLLPGRPLERGDLVFYGTPDKVHHVGLYIGAGQMINAPTFGKPVRVANYRYPGDDYVGASRPAARPGSLPFAPRLGRALPWTAKPGSPRRAALPPAAPPVVAPAPASAVAAPAALPAGEAATSLTSPVGTSAVEMSGVLTSAAVVPPVSGAPLPNGTSLPLVPGVSLPGVPLPGVPLPGVPLPGVPLPGVPLPDVSLPGVPVVSLPGVPAGSVPILPTPILPTPVVPAPVVPAPVVPAPVVPAPVVGSAPVAPTVPAPVVPAPVAPAAPAPVVPAPVVPAPVVPAAPAPVVPAAPAPVVPTPPVPVPDPAVLPTLTRARAAELLAAGTAVRIVFLDAATGLRAELTRPPSGV